jgi:hypothetical protein
MNEHFFMTTEFLEWDDEERSLQNDNTTQVPEDNMDTSSSPVPAPSPTTTTIAPTSIREESPVESPTTIGDDDAFTPSSQESSDWTLPPNPTSWETETQGYAPTPSSGGESKPSYSPTNGQNIMGILVIVIVAIVVVLCGWKFCKVWKARRERHMLRLQSTRVDAVLGDMQMVSPTGDYDDDPELL